MEQSETTSTVLPDGVEEYAGKLYMRDAKGALMPIDLVSAKDRLMDELVRKMIGYARDLSAQIGRFRGHCAEDVGSFQALLDQEYGVTIGGRKGNITLTTYDRSLSVTVKVADQLKFGPELQQAKRLVDACLAEWSAGSRDEIRAIVNRAFDVEKEGNVNRSALFMLLRVDIQDARWKRAMDAIRDSIHVEGSKTYYLFQERAADGGMRSISIDLARA